MPNQLVLHLAGPGTTPFPDFAAAARVAANARTELPEAGIEIVVQGPAVRELVPDSPAAGLIAQLAGDGIAVSACGNSLRSAGLAEPALPDGVVVVPAAVAYLASRQFQGAAYVRI
ncbi:hypothetical protein D477_017799 [Arthrobacter crystallopoietes BAB-32]|uniref:Uncharacterized protein n=1 Tax=Arthrobacter crystallopoietes BAB-32 TaxID=1246476 RepID=N1UYJ6_9MICC|nr:DsrE family protein [Arthrobacter crystallopoietes]EMY32902.1 hypothetical protein D477_017799 [Arthrobacter crystallopoietes BAB-32]